MVGGGGPSGERRFGLGLQGRYVIGLHVCLL
jgi:hypothetical protein